MPSSACKKKKEAIDQSIYRYTVKRVAPAVPRRFDIRAQERDSAPYSKRRTSFFFEGYGDHLDLHSFPTRRSSDLPAAPWLGPAALWLGPAALWLGLAPPWLGDRKSTRLNSSHLVTSYAVFCLK